MTSASNSMACKGVWLVVMPNEQRLSDAAAMLEEGKAVHGVR
jgi:hypothetical protein